MTSVARELAGWAAGMEVSQEDSDLARRALLDTLASALAARDLPLRHLVDDAPDALRWSAVGHVLDFDDLHMPSTAHISVVCVPAALAAGGGERAYLAGAGVMARLGAALGWTHYRSGWHATCTAGAPAAAAAAAVARGLDEAGIARAMALAVPAAGGVHRAFGTDSKALQVAFAAAAGVRAAELARRGATADPRALDQWFGLVGGDEARLDTSGPAVPGGLAIKIYPCCYALQRPISALSDLEPPIDPDAVERVVVRTLEATIRPLIHPRPSTALEGKFSLEYGLACALIDGAPGFESFSDAAVRRPEAQRLMERVEVQAVPGGEMLLDGQIEIDIELAGGGRRAAHLRLPPGAPGRAATDEEFATKLRLCGEDVPDLLAGVDWGNARDVLEQQFPRHAPGSGPL